MEARSRAIHTARNKEPQGGIAVVETLALSEEAQTARCRWNSRSRRRFLSDMVWNTQVPQRSKQSLTP